MTREDKGRTSEKERGEGSGAMTGTANPLALYKDIMSLDPKRGGDTNIGNSKTLCM